MKDKTNIDKFYDFINMCNLIIKHCAKKGRKYEVSIYYLGNKLYFRINDHETMKGIFDENIECNQVEAEMIENTITNEFILEHQISLSSFLNMSESDLFSYYLSNEHAKVIFVNNCYYNENNEQMIIHELKNSIFVLRIYYYNGISEIVEKLHRDTLLKLSESNNNNNIVKVKK